MLLLLLYVTVYNSVVRLKQLSLASQPLQKVARDAIFSAITDSVTKPFA